MFKDTRDVEDLIAQLNRHFLFATALLLLFMLITIYFLSKALTRPLISMKEATTKLSKGIFQWLCRYDLMMNSGSLPNPFKAWLMN